MRNKAAREAAGLTQCELADQMGVSQTTVSQWETEVALPRARDLPKLANVLGCTISDLFVSNDIAAAEMREEVG